MRAFTHLLFLAILLCCAACAEPAVRLTQLSPTTASPTPTSVPSPTPEPKVLTVCMPGEPDSLYLYGTSSIAAQHVWQAIYDGPYDSRGYTYQPVILTDLPNFANGGASLEPVAVQAGERVLAASGEVVELASGISVRGPDGRWVAFDGAPVWTQKMVVTYTLRSDVFWSDGVPVAAEDSVFSFVLAVGEATSPEGAPVTAAGLQVLIDRTDSYRATDVRTVVWSGVPGFIDHAYQLNFWHPLPRHAWGSFSAAELSDSEAVARTPLGWGPFLIDEWVPGERITAVRNPIYFRAMEGLPRVDQVDFRFLADPAGLAEDLAAGRCDVVTHEGAVGARAAVPESAQFLAPATYDTRWELLAFGISPATGYDRPDFFEDVRVRQAIARCIDRQAVADIVQDPPGRVSHSALPPEHPLYAGDALAVWAYDPIAGQQLLASAGWWDGDGDRTREAHGIPGIADGTALSLSYSTTDDPVRFQISQRIQADLEECGIQAIVESVSPLTLFAPGPEGVLFGRRFDLAQFAWRASPDPLCDMFLSEAIPDWGRWSHPNVAGFLDDAYDSACLGALEALPGSEDYVTGQAEAHRILSERLSVLPLAQRQRFALARTPVIGLDPDTTQASELWNIEQLDIRP